MAQPLLNGQPVAKIDFNSLKVTDVLRLPETAFSRDAFRRLAKSHGVQIRTVAGPWIGWYEATRPKPKVDLPKRKYTLRTPEERKATADQLRRRSERHAWHRKNAAAVAAMLA